MNSVRLTFCVRTTKTARSMGVDIVADDGVAWSMMYIIVCCGKRVEGYGPVDARKEGNWLEKKNRRPFRADRLGARYMGFRCDIAWNFFRRWILSCDRTNSCVVDYWAAVVYRSGNRCRSRYHELHYWPATWRIINKK